MFWPMTSTMSDAPPAPYYAFPATPQQRLTYIPAWPAVQSGPLPPMPPTQPAPLAPFPVPPAPVAPLALLFQAPPVSLPMVPPQHFSYPPGGWGPMPNYYPAPVQQYPIG